MTLYLRDSDFDLHVGDALEVLKTLPAESVHCCVTSPPYWGLRDYGDAGQFGLEATPDLYVSRMVEVFREVRRVLRSDGTLWLNLGDSYASAWACDRRNVVGAGSLVNGKRGDRPNRLVGGLKEKDLVGIPWRVAFALQADGWYLRSDIIWSKPNPMPESVIDRPTKSHEYVFMFSKGPRYFFDQEAVREPMAPESPARYTYAFGGDKAKALAEADRNGIGVRTRTIGMRDATAGRNVRSVWQIATHPYPEAHFAVFPPELARRCIVAGCPDGGTVLDPFLGSGTTALVARQQGRRCVGIELNATYAEMAARRLGQQSLFATDLETTEGMGSSAA